jgi:hypothetical protein
VICGGGWGGLTAARYLRELIPNPTWCCWSATHLLVRPHEQQVAGGHRGTDFVNHDMLRPANKYGYTLLQTEVTGFERDKKLVRTAHGLIEYDFLILSGGIRNAYDAWFGNDQRAIDYTRTHFPTPTSPTRDASLKQQGQELQGRHAGDDAAAAAAPLPALALRARLPDRLAHQEEQDPRQDPDPRPQAQDRPHRHGLQAGLRGAVRRHHHPCAQRRRARGGPLQQADQDRPATSSSTTPS